MIPNEKSMRKRQLKIQNDIGKLFHNSHPQAFAMKVFDRHFNSRFVLLHLQTGTRRVEQEIQEMNKIDGQTM